jgi:hypothetical protein
VTVPSSFADVCALAPEARDHLLVTGAPIERLWSAWALGLATGAGSAERIEAAALAEPHAGLRRHFVVVLAGMTRSAALEALALHDPAPLVRATALQYLTRLAPAMPGLWALIAERLGAEPGADGRRVILETAPAEPVSALREPVLARLADAADDVCAEAMDLVARWSQIDRSLVAELWRHDRPPIGARTAAMRHRLLAAWLGAEGLRAVLVALVAVGNAGAAVEVVAMADAAGTIEWRDVEPLASIGGAEIRDVIVRAMRRDLGAVPPQLLLEHAVAHGLVTYASFLYELGRGLPALEPTDVAPSLRAALPPIVVAIEVDIQRGAALLAGAELEPDAELDLDFDLYDDDDEATVLGNWVAGLTRLRDELARLA